MKIETKLANTKIKYLIYSSYNDLVDVKNKDEFYQLYYTQIKLNLLKSGKNPNNLEFNLGELPKLCNLIFSGSTRKKDLEVLIESGVLEKNGTVFKLIDVENKEKINRSELTM